MQQSPLAPEFSCDVQPDGDQVVVRLAGELDMNVAADVEATVQSLLGVGFARVVVDLRDLSFLDTSGVHAFVSAHESAQRCDAALSLIRGPQQVQRVFELTATASLLCFAATGRR
jgi:anti-anti-sigma factor